MPTTIRDIAEQLDLSKATVSKALNGYTDVSSATRDRVQQTARKMGYQPSATARNLRRGQTDKIGLFLNTAVDYVVDYLSGILPGAVKTAQGLGKNLVIYTITDHDPSHLLAICRAGEVDGVILFSTHYDPDTMNMLLEDRFPLVVIGRDIPDERVSTVVPDYNGGSYLATQHLIDLGHRRIAFTTRPELGSANEAHLNGHLDALRDAGIVPDEELFVETRLQPESGVKAAERLMMLPEVPTAIRAFHDLIAVDIVNALQRQGFRVPQDVSVIGFDGLRARFTTLPHITTLKQPLEYIGRRVTEIIHDQIANPDSPPIKEVVPVEFDLRGSTGVVSCERREFPVSAN